MAVDSDRHLPMCQVLPEAQNRLRHSWLEVRAGLFPGIVGWAQLLPQCCPVLMPWDPGRTLTSSALITNEDLIFREPRIART